MGGELCKCEEPSKEEGEEITLLENSKLQEETNQPEETKQPEETNQQERNKKEMTVNVGDEFKYFFGENRSTPFRVVLVNEEEVKDYVDIKIEFIRKNRGNKRVGVGGISCFTFTANKPGEIYLNFEKTHTHDKENTRLLGVFKIIIKE